MSDTTPETPSPAPAPSLEWTLRPRADKDGWTLLLNGLIKAGGSWQHCLNTLDAALRQATQHPAVAEEEHCEDCDPSFTCWQRPRECRKPAPDAAAQGGTPDVDKCWLEFWAPIVAETGIVDMKQVKRELYDYWQVMERVPQVYCHITGDQVSKILTDAAVVMSLADDNYSRLSAEDAEDAQSQLTAAQARIAELERERDAYTKANSLIKYEAECNGSLANSMKTQLITTRASLAAVEKERDEVRRAADDLSERAMAVALDKDDLKAAPAAAQERVKALEADGARLDAAGRGEWQMFYDYHCGGYQIQHRQKVIGKGDTLRQALDAARAQSSEEGRP